MIPGREATRTEAFCPRSHSHAHARMVLRQVFLADLALKNASIYQKRALFSEFDPQVLIPRRASFRHLARF